MGFEEILSEYLTIKTLMKSTVFVGATSWIAKAWATHSLSKDSESYKIKLKKSEFLFEKEYEAATELTRLKRGIVPKKKFPEMDWGDACEHIADSFEHIENKLDSYLCVYNVVLGETIRQLIGDSVVIAADRDSYDGSAGKKADELFKKLKEAEKLLIAKVLSQSST